MWHRVDVVLTDVSEERIASIFRVEGKIRKSASEETVRTGASRLMLEINSAI
jgi:predicted transcriptional regulator